MPVAIVSPGTGFVLPSTFPVMGLGLVSLWMLNMRNVVKHRRASGVNYPTLYATEAEAEADPKKMAYNCAQRAHQNTLEYLPGVLGMFAYVGCWYPLLATVSVIVWTLSRVPYTINYSSGSPSTRMDGLAKLGWVGRAGLIFPTIYISFVETYRLFA